MFAYRADFMPHSFFSVDTNTIDYLCDDELADRTALKGEARAKFLHDFNTRAYNEVLKEMKAEHARLMPIPVRILAKNFLADKDITVAFSLLGTKDHSVLGANMEATRAAMSASQMNSTLHVKTFATAQTMEYKDAITDVVHTFKSNEVTARSVPGATMDLKLYPQINSHRIISFDVVPVETDKVKVFEDRSGKSML